jgi:hypothetical protein
MALKLIDDLTLTQNMLLAHGDTAFSQGEVIEKQRRAYATCERRAMLQNSYAILRHCLQSLSEPQAVGNVCRLRRFICLQKLARPFVGSYRSNQMDAANSKTNVRDHSTRIVNLIQVNPAHGKILAGLHRPSHSSGGTQNSPAKRQPVHVIGLGRSSRPRLII